MKAIMLYGAFFVFGVSTCFAAPTYGTHMPSQNKFHIGVQTHAVLENKLEGIHGEYQSLRQFVQLSYGLKDWLSLDLKAGSGNVIYYPDAGPKISYASGFAGGYGLRVKMYDADRIKVVGSFQHISVHPPSESVGSDKYDAILDDWEGSVLASYAWQHFTPYMGVKVGRRDYTFWVNEHDRNRVKSDETKMVGLVLGMDFDIDDNAWINVEAQMFDVEAISVSVNFRF